MPRRYADDDDDYDFDRPRVRRARRRRRRWRVNNLPISMPVGIALGGAVLLFALSFAVRGAGLSLAFVGLVIVIVAQLWFLLVVLSDSIGQLLLCLVVPFYSFIYFLTHFEETKYPFFLNVFGVFVIVGCIISGAAREGVSSDDGPVADGRRPEPRTDPPRVEPPRADPPKADPIEPPNPPPPFEVDPQAKAAGPTVYVAALTPFAYQAGPWKYAVGATGSNGDEPIKVEGNEFKYGISACPPDSHTQAWRVSYAPGGQFKRLKGWGALNDYGQKPWGKVAFVVWGDGRKLWESAPLGKANESAWFDLDVTGVKVLTLETRVKEGSHLHAHAVWLDPWLER